MFGTFVAFENFDFYRGVLFGVIDRGNVARVFNRISRTRRIRHGVAHFFHGLDRSETRIVTIESRFRFGNVGKIAGYFFVARNFISPVNGERRFNYCSIKKEEQDFSCSSY